MPSTTLASVLRIEPPTSVQARPVTRPTSLFSCAKRVAELDDAQEVVDVLAGDGDVVVLAFLDHLARHLAADVADFALQVADAGFARVGADESSDGFVGELDVLFRQARRPASAS